MSTRASLLPLVRKFFENDPNSAVHSLETMGENEAVEILKSLPENMASTIFPKLQVSTAAAFLKELSPELMKTMVDKVDPLQGAALLITLPEELRKPFFDNLPDKVRKEIQTLLTYPEKSAGRMMSTEFIAFHTDAKVRESIQKLRQLARSKSPSSYVYVIDADNHLVGVMYMRDLLFATGDEVLGTLMKTDVFSVDAFMDQEEVMAELNKRKFFAAPVVDSENHLLGIVKSEQLLVSAQAEATEDILKMVGAGEDEKAFSRVSFSLKKRLPWLYVNLATAFLAAAVVSLFEDTIARITVLAVFLPVVAGQGGNAGAQSLAVVMRGLVMREVPASKYRKLVTKEMFIGLWNGILIGTVTAIAAWIWQGNPYLGVVIGLAMISNMLAAGLFGALIPITLKALGRDPAQASSIILTTVTDIVGFSAFLGFAVLFQRWLI